MMLKILVDEDMPRPTGNLLRSFKIDAFDVREIGLKGATDEEIFKYAQKKEQIILSLRIYMRQQQSINYYRKRYDKEREEKIWEKVRN